MTLYEVRKEGKMLERIVKIFGLIVLSWALGYAYCWFALMK